MKTFNDLIKNSKGTLATIEGTLNTKTDTRKQLEAGDPKVIDELLKTITNAATTCALLDTDIDGAVNFLLAKVQEVGAAEILAAQYQRIFSDPDRRDKIMDVLKRIVNAD